MEQIDEREVKRRTRHLTTEHVSRYYTTDRVETYVAESRKGLAETPDITPELARRREEAISRFASTGFPTTKHEEWKYTSLRAFLAQEFRTIDRHTALTSDLNQTVVAATGFRSERAHRLVFLNGFYRPDLSHTGELPEGVVLMPLSTAIAERTELVADAIASYPESFSTPFTELNTAQMQDGLFLRIPRNVSVEGVVHLLFLVDGAPGDVACYPRNLVVAESGSSVTVLEEYRSNSDGASLTCAVTEVEVGDGARVDHVKIQTESEAAFHIAAAHARLGRDASYHNNAITLGGKISRNDPSALLAAEGGHAALDGLYIADSGQTLDAHTSIDHASAHCTSHELYKGILRGDGHAVFNGKIFVREGAQKTDSKQSNMNLLLSDSAEIDTKPQLEIFADDVKCTHGATIGRLDDTGLFYLRSRGIGAQQAEAMLTWAFAAEVMEHIADGEIAEYATSLLEGCLEH